LQSQWFETFFRGLAVDFWRRAMTPEMTAADVDFLEKTLCRASNSRLLDVPCGDGRHSIGLARRGHRVSGVDISEEFLAAARAGSGDLSVDWRQGDMRDLPWTSEFDGAFCFGNSFGYLDADGARVFFGQLAHALKSGGRLAIETGVAAESILPTLLQKRWHKLGDLFVLSEARYRTELSRLDIDYTFIQRAEVETRQVISYVLTVSEIRRMLEDAGFGGMVLLGSVQGEPYQLGTPRLIVLAEKT
jgi:SAM-dependent methyltransferase